MTTVENAAPATPVKTVEPPPPELTQKDILRQKAMEAIEAGDTAGAVQIIAELERASDPNAFQWPLTVTLPGSSKVVKCEKKHCYVCLCHPHSHVNVTDSVGRRYRIPHGALLSSKDFPSIKSERDPRWFIPFGGDPRGKYFIVPGYSAR